MPRDLAALLVEEGAVSKADLDRALARQSQLGGALDTALLELELISEGHLLAFLAHAAGIPAAPLAAFQEIDPRARRVFPAKVAERHRLAPFALDGRELSVVVAHPVEVAAIDDIGFMLSLSLVPHVGLEWRVQELIHRLYGGQLPARLASLAEALAKVPTNLPPTSGEAALEPETSAPPAPSIEDTFFAAGDSGTFVPPAAPVAVPEPVTEPVPPAPESEPGEGAGVAAGAQPLARGAGAPSFSRTEPDPAVRSGFSRDQSEPAEPLLAALEQAFEAYDITWTEPAGAPPASVPGEAEPSPDERSVEPEAIASPGDAGEEAAPPESEEPPAEPDRSAPPQWSLDDARTALAAARHRDEVVLVALRYARDFFEFSALFAVTRDAVVGHDALGIQEDARTHSRGTAIYASDPGIVKTVLETRAPYLGPAAQDAVGTANILDGLWRGNPRAVLLYPILLGDRPVAVLYADNGDAPVSARRLGDLLLFLSTVGGAFERIIRSQKKRGRTLVAPTPTAPSVPPVEEPPPAGPAPEWTPAAPAAVSLEPEPEPEPEPEHEVEAEPEAEPPRPAAPSGASPSPGAPIDADAVAFAMVSLLADPQGSAEHATAIVDLVFDPRPEVAAAAREALASHRSDAAVRPLPERLRRSLLSGVGDRPVLAARALGALRDVESIPILIQSLDGAAPAAAQAAAEALAQITLTRLGSSPQKWLRWWKENRGRSRAEWLFSALTSEDRDLRLAASGELRSTGEPPVKYTPDLPSAELEAAARAWWVWWSRQGKKG